MDLGTPRPDTYLPCRDGGGGGGNGSQASERVDYPDRRLRLLPLNNRKKMARATVVENYKTPKESEGQMRTFRADSKTENAARSEPIVRPKDYTVSWHYNPAVEQYHFGPSHPMKPWRLKLTKQLIVGYKLHAAMDCYKTRAATAQELEDFHTNDYVEFLQRVVPGYSVAENLARYNIGDDCPIFDGLYDYCTLYAGASVDAASKICSGRSDIAINWSGGLHHAKKSEASGFCYVNDIVLAILQLLRFHPRVLYIDIDVHHGDGVEQAFWSTDRVMTLSFHKYDRDNFFPGTGPLDSTGPTHPLNPGRHHSLNVPLHDGIEDHDYCWLFREIVRPCIERYGPAAIVLQCGADSLGGDRLGCFNLNIQAHGECVAFVKSFGLPMIVLGGGGYTPRNVARLWAHETAVCVGARLPDALPDWIPDLAAFKDEPILLPNLSDVGRYENKNSREYLWSLIAHVKDQLSYIKAPPSVQSYYIPPDISGRTEDGDKALREQEEDREEWRKAKEGGDGGRDELMGG